jgi:hypothetical protein
MKPARKKLDTSSLSSRGRLKTQSKSRRKGKGIDNCSIMLTYARLSQTCSELSHWFNQILLIVAWNTAVLNRITQCQISNTTVRGAQSFRSIKLSIAPALVRGYSFSWTSPSTIQVVGCTKIFRGYKNN